MVKITLVLLLSATIMAPASMAFAQSMRQETIVIQRPEEYQLRILESQVQMLRNKLYAQQRMDDKQQQIWLGHYNEVAKRLEAWNKFSDSYGLQQ
jgi:LPS O-antigen subunit length determinant protein (WzzB/FepE family)